MSNSADPAAQRRVLNRLNRARGQLNAVIATVDGWIAATYHSAGRSSSD